MDHFSCEMDVRFSGKMSLKGRFLASLFPEDGHAGHISKTFGVNYTDAAVSKGEFLLYIFHAVSGWNF